jgi:hypothetical protein
MNLKHFLVVSLLATSTMCMVGCDKVPAGSVGVKVYL